MSISNVNYDPAPEQLRTTAQANTPTEQARFDPNGDLGFRLANALNVAVPEMGKTLKAQDEKEKKAAQAYFNSMTLDDLNLAVKAKTLLPSQSPVFVATVQNLYGENTMNQLEASVAAKVKSGELNFSTPEEADAYLVNERNKVLQDHSKFTIAGFDKGWTRARDKIVTASTTMREHQLQQEGVGVSTQNILDTYKTTQGADGDKIQAAMEKYNYLRTIQVLNNPETSRNVLKNLALTVSDTGNPQALQQLLDYKLDNGITVGVSIKPEVAMHLTRHAESKWNQAQREAQKAQILAQAQAIQKRNQDLVATAVSTGSFALLPSLQGMSPTTGEPTKFNSVEAGQQYIQQEIATKKIPVEQQAALYASNNIPDPEATRIMKAGVSNLDTIKWSSDGKPIGQLSDVGKGSLEFFTRYNKISPRLTREMVGDKSYEVLSQVSDAVTQQGAQDYSEAARLVNSANSLKLPEDSVKQKMSVYRDAANTVFHQDGGFFTRKAHWLGTLFNNDIPNLALVQNMVRKRAELLIRAGVEPEQALKGTIELYADPKRTTRINNTLYPNEFLPTVPKGEDVGEWMERYRKEVAVPIAQSRYLDPKHTILTPSDGGSFLVTNGAGIPLTKDDGTMVRVTKESFSQFVQDGMKKDRTLKVKNANERADGTFTSKTQGAVVEGMLAQPEIPGQIWEAKEGLDPIMQSVGEGDSH